MKVLVASGVNAIIFLVSAFHSEGWVSAFGMVMFTGSMVIFLAAQFYQLEQ